MTNGTLQPGNSKMYGKEPPIVTNTFSQSGLALRYTGIPLYWWI